MLGSTNIVAFVPIKDSAKARAFYEGVLGLRFVKDDGFALVLEANGIMVRAAKMKEFTPAQFTILGWQVSDIEQVVRGLAADDLLKSVRHRFGRPVRREGHARNDRLECLLSKGIEISTQ